jgi:effector-binding domain-containing protein
MRFIVPIVLLALLVTLGSAASTRQPADKPNPDLPDFVISDMRVQEFPPARYAYITQQTTLAQIAEAIGPAMEKFGEAIMQHEIQPMGAPVFVYKGATGEMDKPFELQVGFPVSDLTKAQGDMQVRELEKYRCATVLFSGSMQNIPQAYGKLFADIQQAGLQPSGDSREMHLYFESVESPNNIVLIMVGVK